MTVRWDYFAGTVQHNNWSAMEVEKAELVDGVWFPVQASCRSGTTAASGMTELHYTVEAAVVGKVTEADLTVPDAPKAAGKE
jgi:hypothetical protein